MFKKSLIALALSVAATGSFAQVYIQGALGRASINAPVTAPATVNKASTGSKFVVGYELGNGWAVEGMAISFGKAVITSGASTIDVKASSLAIGGAYNAELGGGHGLKFGLYYGSNKADVSGAIALVTAANQGAQSTSGLNYGLGYSYDFNKTAALTVDYDAAPKFKQERAITGSFGAGLLSVGVRVKF